MSRRGLVVGLVCVAIAALARAQDCNNSGIDDACDVACGEPAGPCDVPGCGTSPDCNANGVPDECDIDAPAEVVKLTAAGDEFGWSVAISGGAAVVGAYLDYDRGSDSGSAYVFRNVAGSWGQVAKLRASDGADADLADVAAVQRLIGPTP